MSYKKPTFVTGEIYHIYNRGVEKREIFLETSDYFRMVNDLYKLNDKNAVFNSQYHPKRNAFRQKSDAPREMLVEILAFVLMPNHYHLVLRQIEENGVVKFMQKLGTGYTNYFNKKNDRVGPLFQGGFKAIYIDTEEYLCNLFGYIHTNPVVLAENYRSSTSIGMDFLEQYKWSSYRDYIGIKNFSSVTSRDFFIEITGSIDDIKASTEAWVMHPEGKKAALPEFIEVRLR